MPQERVLSAVRGCQSYKCFRYFVSPLDDGACPQQQLETRSGRVEKLAVAEAKDHQLHVC